MSATFAIFQSFQCSRQSYTSQVKFELSEKKTKFEKVFLVVLTNQLIYLLSKRQNHEEDFFQIMCASQKVQTLTVKSKQNSYIGQSWFSELPDYSCHLVW